MGIMYIWIVHQPFSYHMVHLVLLAMFEHVSMADLLMCVLLLMKYSTLLIELVTQ